jgi:hypothetical protein
VVGKLPNAVSLSCRSLLLSINFEDKDAYERLKEHLCKNYSKSKWQQGYALLDHPGLGDCRPSQLLQDMRALLPEKEAEGVLFQCLFLKRLPTSMSDAVMAAGLENIEDMAAMADRLHDKPAAAGVSAAAHSGPAFDPMGARLGSVKRVRFSCGNTIIPQVFNPSPPIFKPHPGPDPKSGSGRPRRVRRIPDRLGISVDPLSSPLGGEL